MIGESFGNFRIVARLGGGGMGDVFLAEQAAIDTKVAIKVLKPEVSRDKDHVQRFFNEARAVGKIKHAGTVKIFEGGYHTSGLAYLVMEYLEGETLAARIQRATRLSLGAICDVGRQIASILAATHAVGITHRDLKPENVFIVPDAELASGERVKILDFGIAKLTGSTLASKPQTLGTMGTPSYMAPEQWGNSANVDARADAYSLGCVLFEMAGGRPPFVGASFADLCAMHLTMAPPSLTSIVGEVPPRLEMLTARLLAKRPEDRPTMQEVQRELDELGRDAPRPMDATLPPGSRPVPHLPTPTTLQSAASQIGAPPRKRRGAAIAIVAVGLIGGVVAIAIVAGGGDGGGSGSGIAIGSGSGSRIAIGSGSGSGIVARQPAPEDAAIAPVAADAATAPVGGWREHLAAVNPFVDVHGVTMLGHQVTSEELDGYVAANPKDAPLHRDGDPRAAAAWMTFERAQRFCRALEADLPTVAQWKRAANGGWGIHDGPLQEWTSTVDNGLATVMGGAASMPEAERVDAIKNPMSKETEQLAGAGAKDTVVASARIGFRCAKPSHAGTSAPHVACDAKALADAARALVHKGEHAAAVDKFEASRRCKDDPQLYGLIYRASCKSGRAASVAKYYKLLSAQQQARLAQICLEGGVDPITGAPR